MISRVLIVTASALTLAACSGGSSDKSETKTETTTTTTTATPAETATPAATASAPAAGAPAPTDTATLDGVQFASLTGDVAAGEKVFVQCKTCHVTDEGQNRIGPSLHKIVGRQAGTVPGYSYSAANKNSGITWTQEKMAFAGIPDAQKRADLIAWLATK